MMRFNIHPPAITIENREATRLFKEKYMTSSTNTPWDLSRHLHKWNAEEQRQLERMFRNGADFVTIAQELHRTEYAIIGKLKDKKMIYWDKETESYKNS